MAPRRPGAAPLLLRAFSPIPGMVWYSRAEAQSNASERRFRFVDIGAGTAASVEPADDFAWPELLSA
jgi:hypothetical protein